MMAVELFQIEIGGVHQKIPAGTLARLTDGGKSGTQECLSLHSGLLRRAKL
jgi:hypothetical protein